MRPIFTARREHGAIHASPVAAAAKQSFVATASLVQPHGFRPANAAIKRCLTMLFAKEP